MGCGCGKAKANMKWQVDFGAGGAPAQKYDTVSEAKAALKAAGNPPGSTFKAVPA